MKRPVNESRVGYDVKYYWIVEGVQAGACLIAAAVIFFAETSVFQAPLRNLWTKGEHFGLCWQGCVIFAAVLLLSLKWKISPVWLLIGSAAVGWLLFLI